MIAHLNGICADVTTDKVILDVGGIGFEIGVPASAYASLPGIGEPLMLYTYLSVREDGMSLFGFLTREELALFKQLIAISGIGPKGALGLLGTLGVEELRFAVLTGDAAAITRAPGIGKKTAERLVLELKDRFSSDDLLPGADFTGAQTLVPGEGIPAHEEAVSALCALGYTRATAMQAVKRAVSREAGAGEADTETLLKAALKELV